jgi:hypothetical protein
MMLLWCDYAELLLLTMIGCCFRGVRYAGAAAAAADDLMLLPWGVLCRCFRGVCYAGAAAAADDDYYFLLLWCALCRSCCS